MSETSMFWEGTTVGDATLAPYDSHTDFAKVFMAMTQQNRTVNKGGVFTDELNELVVSGVASPLTVATGRAMVYGTWYESDAVISIAVPTPAGATTGHRVVLTKDWAAQTVRCELISSPTGTAAIPAMTQTAGVEWQISLASLTITTGGVITVTDTREYLPIPAGSIGVQELSAATMMKLFSGTILAPVAAIDISGIPQTYKHLILYVNGMSDSGGSPASSGILIQFNLDAGANYEVNEFDVEHNSNLFHAYRWTGLTYGLVGEVPYPTSGPGTVIANIPFYTNTDYYKNVLSEAIVEAGIFTRYVNDHTIWRSLAAINAIRLTCNAANFNVGVQYTLYGVPA